MEESGVDSKAPKIGKGRKYECDDCGKVFHHKSSLRTHILVHETERTTFACEICKKEYLYESGLHKHRKIHQDVRYPCAFCNKSFFYKYYLKRHTLIHTGEKKYKCNQCWKSYFTSRSLEVHMETHDNTQSFECLDCRFIYLLQKSCTRHMHDKHKGESIQTQQFQCTNCLKSITSNCTTKINLNIERTICLDCYVPPKKTNPLQVVPPPPASLPPPLIAPANNWSLVLLGFKAQNGTVFPCYAAVDAAGNSKPTEGSNNTLSIGGDSFIKSPEVSNVTVSEDRSNVTLPGGNVIWKLDERCITMIPMQEGGGELLSKEEPLNKTQEVEPILQDVREKEIVKQEVEKTFNVEQVLVENNLDVKLEIKEEIIND